jgi:hypothetical protein
MTKQSLIGLAALVSLALAPATGRATPFELITASDVEINITGGTVAIFTAWAWITPQAGYTLTDAEIEGATFNVAFSNPDVIAQTSNLSSVETFTLNAGDFAGNRLDTVSTNNTVYDTELLPGESRTNTLAIGIRFTAPNTSYTGSGVLDVQFGIGSDVANFSTNVDFLATSLRFDALTSQRVASIPEPSTAVLASLGLVGLAARRRV